MRKYNVMIDVEGAARFSCTLEAADVAEANVQAWARWRSWAAHPARMLAEHRGECQVYVTPAG